MTNQLTGPALWLFIIGVCVAGAMARLAAVRIWWQHRSAYHQLRPLRSAMHDVLPADQLDRHSPHPEADRLSPWRIHRRYWRRIVEIRDGLVQLSPRLRDLGYTPDVRLTADQLRGALDRQRTGIAPSSRHATLVAAPATGGNAEADVDELLHLSRALQQDSPCNDS